LSYRVVLRGTSFHNRRSWQIRAVLALVALILVLPSERAWLGVPLVLLGVVGPALNYLMTLHNGGRLRDLTLLRMVARAMERTDGRHQLNPPAYVELLGLVALLMTFSWVVTDLAGPARLVGLLLAVVFTTSVAHAIFNDHTWFNPAETSPPWWHELLRWLAGPLTAAVVAAIVLTGSWTELQWTAAAIISVFPLINSMRIKDLDRTVAVLPAIIEEERAHGRELVISETERALAQPLADLELLAARHRTDAPVLLDLAEHARLRLQETLRSAGRVSEHPLDMDELLGPVLTLARAIGVNVHVTLPPGTLSHDEAQLAIWALRDLVGNAINAGGSEVSAQVSRSEGEVVISVLDDAGPMPAGVWKSPGTSSERLERHLVSLGGSLQTQELPAGKVVEARWLTPQRNGKVMS
jgi:hypothetical protein